MDKPSITPPQEGELVVASITTVKQNGAYASLDEFPGINGFVFIGEIASGWVKNIRAHVREGQRVIDYVVEAEVGGAWVPFSAGTTVS